MKALAKFFPKFFLAACCANAVLAAGAARAENFQFLAAPATDLNRVFRLDKASGEIGACQYALTDDASLGVTLCYPAGEGAGPQAASDYALVASRHDREAGVFRVDLRTGAMSVCYVLKDAVVCTPPKK